MSLLFENRYASGKQLEYEQSKKGEKKNVEMGKKLKFKNPQKTIFTTITHINRI